MVTLGNHSLSLQCLWYNIEYENKKQMRKLIKILLKNQSLCGKIGKEAKKTALKNSWNKIAKEYKKRFTNI